MAKPKPVRSPITWLGGKGVVKTKILPLLPPHDYYVEPFGGGASILPLGAPEIGTQMSQQRQSKPSSTAPSTASSGSRAARSHHRHSPTLHIASLRPS